MLNKQIYRILDKNQQITIRLYTYIYIQSDFNIKIQKNINNIKLPQMKQEKNKIYQSSKTIKLVQNCTICCEQKERYISQQQFDKFRLPDICYDCWFAHVKNYIMRISYRAGDDVISPFNQGPPIDIIKCINSFSDVHSKEIEQALFKKYSSFTKQIQKCPSQTCDFVYIGNRCKWGSNENVYNCPKCDIPLSTNKSTSFKTLMASFYLIMANKCPKCDIPIQKISGCPHMTCPCGHHFCWYCYKDHPSGTGKRVYPFHSVPQCAFIFLSKIIIFIMCIMSLLITFNGNWIIKDIFRIITLIFSVVFRAAIMDGFVLAQIMYLMMRRRRRFPNTYSKKSTKKYIILSVILNLVFIGVLYFMEQLTYFMAILVGELVLASLCYSIGYGVIYSIETWFEFIA